MSESALSTRPLYVADADPEVIRHKNVAVVGYGSQGHAHALNLTDAPVGVSVGLREGSSSRSKASEAGLSVMSIDEAAAWADIVMILAPDPEQPTIFTDHVAPQLQPGNAIAFAHGFAVHHGLIDIPDGVDCFMVAPKGPGHLVRESFVNGGGVPMLLAVQQDATGLAHQLGLAYAHYIGGTRAGVIDTTFEAETVTDLFGEQTVLVGALYQLVIAGYEVLIEAGYAPEMAYFEVMHELKLIVDLFYKGGWADTFFSISDTAEWGALENGAKIIDPDDIKRRMQERLADIQSGDFARRWMDEYRSGGPNWMAAREQMAAHPIEAVGRELRGMMPWLNPGQTALADVSGG